MTLDELKSQNIWFLWNYAPGKNGKKTKVPMSASGGVTGTSDNLRDTWTDYDTAIRAKEKLSAAGIGFKVPENPKLKPTEDFVMLSVNLISRRQGSASWIISSKSSMRTMLTARFPMNGL